MLTRFDRKYKQNFKDVKSEFPNCHFLMILEDVKDEDGYLIAVSDSPDTTVALCNIQNEFETDKILYTGGFYGNEMSVGIVDFTGRV